MINIVLKDNLNKENVNKYLDEVKEFIKRAEESEEELTKDFSNTDLNTYKLIKLLEYIGYEEYSRRFDIYGERYGIDDLGFIITLNHKENRPLNIIGSGLNFELILSTFE